MDETLENPEYINIDRTVWAQDVDEKIDPILEHLEQQEETIAVLMKALAEQIEKVDQLEEQMEAQATEISRHEVRLRPPPNTVAGGAAGQHTHGFSPANQILNQSSQVQKRRGLSGLIGLSPRTDNKY